MRYRRCNILSLFALFQPSSLINLIGVLDLMKDIHFATFFNSQKSATDNSFKDFIQVKLLAGCGMIDIPTMIAKLPKN